MTNIESMKALKINTSIVFSLAFSNSTILSCFFLLFFTIALYFFIPAVITHIFIVASDFAIPAAITTTRMHINIYQIFASLILTFSQSTTYGLLIIKKWKFSFSSICFYDLSMWRGQNVNFVNFVNLMILDTK